MVLGLCGSGKSYVIERMGVDHLIEEGFCMDGLHAEHHRQLVEWLRAGKHVALSEIQFLVPSIRDAYIAHLMQQTKGGFTLDYLCFENDLPSANWNCRHRGNRPGDPGGRGHIELNERHSPFYGPPAGVSLVPIFRVPASTQEGLPLEGSGV